MRRYYFLVGLVLFFAQASQAQKAKYHSDLVSRLTSHITWAKFNQPYKFVIGVMGNKEDFRFFRENANIHERFGQQTVEVRYYECADKIEECDLLYISQDCRIGLDKIVKKTRKEPILIVSGREGDGSLGAVINFIDKQGKIKFEFNESQATQRGFVVSDALKDIAIII